MEIEHTYNKAYSGLVLCRCGSYHFHIQCGVCLQSWKWNTVPFRAVDGGWRCTDCCEAREAWLKALTPWTPEEALTVRVALSQIADDGDAEPVTPIHRKLATEILSRLERR